MRPGPKVRSCRRPTATASSRVSGRIARERSFIRKSANRLTVRACHPMLCYSLLREAVEQAAAAGGDEIRLRTAARHMRRDPGLLVHGVGDAFTVGVAQHGAAEGAARPVVASQVEIARESLAFQVGARQHVMHVGRVAAQFNGIALFIHNIRAGDLVVVAVQIGDAGGDDSALGILPGAVADTVARIDGAALGSRVRAQIGAPSLGAGTSRSGELLAVLVGACKAAEVRAFAGADAGDEERHIVLLGLDASAERQHHDGRSREHGKTHCYIHSDSPGWDSTLQVTEKSPAKRRGELSYSTVTKKLRPDYNKTTPDFLGRRGFEFLGTCVPDGNSYCAKQ